MASKKETFMQGVVTVMFSQILIKILGLIYTLYLTNREGFGDAGNAIYASGYQIYALLLTISHTSPKSIHVLTLSLRIGDIISAPLDNEPSGTIFQNPVL